MSAPSDDPQVEIRSTRDLRDWLSAHHHAAGSVWLVHWKRHTPHYVAMAEIVDELLCWGWVDSVTCKIDGDRSAHRISRRDPGSAWSAVNKAKIARLRAAGRMRPPGEAAVAAAQQNGMWSFLDDVERLELPDDLATALAGLRPVWEGWPRSVKRGTLGWIKSARTAPTRARRIEDVRAAAADGQRPSPFRR